MDNYPVPTYLKSFFKVNETVSNISNLEGEIICDCGCTNFKIKHNKNRKYNVALPYAEQEGLKIIVICKNCDKQILLFDEATQGFNGFVCHDCRSAQFETLQLLSCKNCSGSIFSIKLIIEVEDKEQFIEECVSEYPDKFCPDDFVDAFNWIVVTTHCNKCGHVNEWINLELS